MVKNHACLVNHSLSLWQSIYVQHCRLAQAPCVGIFSLREQPIYRVSNRFGISSYPICNVSPQSIVCLGLWLGLSIVARCEWCVTLSRLARGLVKMRGQIAMLCDMLVSSSLYVIRSVLVDACGVGWISWKRRVIGLDWFGYPIGNVVWWSCICIDWFDWILARLAGFPNWWM